MVLLNLPFEGTTANDWTWDTFRQASIKWNDAITSLNTEKLERNVWWNNKLFFSETWEKRNVYYEFASDPTSNDDWTQGYDVGVIWVNTSTNDYFICVDNSTGAAIWSQWGGANTFLALADTSASYSWADIIPQTNNSNDWLEFGNLRNKTYIVSKWISNTNESSILQLHSRWDGSTTSWVGINSWSIAAIWSSNTNTAVQNYMLIWYNADGNGADAILIDTDWIPMVKEKSSATNTPPTGWMQVYAKTDGKLYAKNDAGTEYDLTQSWWGWGSVTQLYEIIVAGTQITQVIYETSAGQWGTMAKFKASLGTVNTWANFTVDLKINWSTVATATITAWASATNGRYVGDTTSFTSATLTENDKVEFEVTQIGSTVAWSDLAVSLMLS